MLRVSRPLGCVQQYGCVGTVTGPDAAVGYRFGAVKLMQNRRAFIVHALVGLRRSLARFLFLNELIVPDDSPRNVNLIVVSPCFISHSPAICDESTVSVSKKIRVA